MNFKNKRTKQAGKSTPYLVSALLLLTMAAGCGENDPTGFGASSPNAEAGKTEAGISSLSESILKLDLGLSSKAVSVSESRLMESNTGHNFNSIVPVKLEIGPGQAFELNEIQQNGIFALYLTGNGDFTLSNSDGTNLMAKSVMLERCSFIDLRITNNNSFKITVSGFLAGE